MTAHEHAPLLFVYGTLRRNHAHTHRLLGDARFLGLASIGGRLYDLGAYPGVCSTSHTDARVSGELYDLTGADVDERLATLDRYEGHEFRRVRVIARLDDGRRLEAWAYLLAEPPPPEAHELPAGIYPRR